MWGETVQFDVMNPECSLIRFVVNDVDNFGDLNQIGQATYPVSIVLCSLNPELFLVKKLERIF